MKKFTADTPAETIIAAEKDTRRNDYQNKRRKDTFGEKPFKNPAHRKNKRNQDRFSNNSLRARDVINRYANEDNGYDDSDNEGL